MPRMSKCFKCSVEFENARAYKYCSACTKKPRGVFELATFPSGSRGLKMVRPPDPSKPAEEIEPEADFFEYLRKSNAAREAIQGCYLTRAQDMLREDIDFDVVVERFGDEIARDARVRLRRAGLLPMTDTEMGRVAKVHDSLWRLT